VAATQTRTIELEREKRKAEQQARLEKTLLDYIPKLVGANESERKTALAVLFIPHSPGLSGKGYPSLSETLRR
jgi:hypothetical protein